MGELSGVVLAGLAVVALTGLVLIGIGLWDLLRPRGDHRRGL